MREKGEAMTASRTRWRYRVLMGGTLFVVVAWSVFWFIAATIVDRHVERAERIASSGGTQIDCVDRSVTGYPFRIEVRCSDTSRIADGNVLATFQKLTIASLVYNPSRVIAEVGGPMTIEAQGAPDLSLDWDLAHASARLDLGEQRLERLDGEVVAATMKASGWPELTVDEFDVNVRRNPVEPADLDLALRVTGLAPAEVGETASLALQLSLHDGAGLLDGDADALLRRLGEAGLAATVEAATFESGSLEVAMAGEVTLAADGLLDGRLDVAIAGHDEGVPYVAVVAPRAEATLEKLATDFLTFAPETTLSGRKAKALTLTIADGVVRAGFVPIFTIPAIHIAQR